MNEIPTPAYVALGAMVVALIAGSFSLLNLVISKDQKVSEFRQEWIDAFRREISELTAAVFHIRWYLAVHGSEGEQADEKTKLSTVAASLRESHETYSKTVTLLLLRINPSEKDRAKAEMNSEFLATLQTLMDAFNENNFSQATELCTILRKKAAPILKSEWERVKRGEPGFRTSKFFAIAVLSIGILGVSVAVTYSWFRPSVSQTLPSGTGTPANKPLQPTGSSRDNDPDPNGEVIPDDPRHER